MRKVVIFLLGLLMLNNCSKESIKKVETLKTVKLTFSKLVLDNATVTVADLLAHIKEEEKAGFAIRSLSSSDANILSVTGKAPNYQLTVKKYGQVTLTMVLSKEGYEEVTLKAVLVIEEPVLIFRKLVTAKSSITSQEILSQIDNHTGYKVKAITLKDTGFGSVTGATPNLKITLTKYGNFTADIVLSKTGHLDATIKDAAFERTVSPAPDDLTFTTLQKTYSSGGRFTANEILGQINGTKEGYRLKAIQDLSPTGIASIAPDEKSIQFIKAGNFTATLVLGHDAKDEVTVKGAQFEITKEKAPTNLSFDKLTLADKFKVTAVELLGNLRGTKAGYQLKAVSFADSSYGTVTGTRPDFVLNLKKPGDFTVNLTLEHDTKKDVPILATIQLVVTKLSFSKYIHTASDGKTIKGVDLMKNILGAVGYSLKSITLKDTSFGTVSGTDITLKKTGAFNATLTLSKAGKDEDIAAEIEAVLPRLTFPKFTIGYKSTLTKAEILAKVAGNSTGYRIKEITLDSGASDYATVTATGLDIKKVGSFGATITLTNPNYFEVSIANAQFQIDRNPAPTDLRFNKFIRTDKFTITAVDLLGNLRGTKSGYQLKAVSFVDSSYGTVTGIQPHFVLNLKKPGDFTVNVTLEHDTKKEVSISAAIQLVVTKLSFSKYIHTASDGKTIKGVDLMKNILGAVGYSLKSITLKDTSFGTVDGTAPNLTVTLKKTGVFNATLTLSKGITTKDIAAEIEAVLPNLTFPKFTIGYKSTLTKAEILAKVTGNSTGYSIQTITLGGGADAYATATATGLDIKKVGAFTATLVLTNPNYFEMSIANAQFQIDKNPAVKDLSFTTLQKAYTGGGSFTANEIWGQINGTKTGYTLKAIENLSPSGIARIAADKKSLQFTKVGNFTATLTLQHPTKVDARIANAKFEIVKGTYTGVLKFLDLTRYVTGGAGSGTITGTQLMAQIVRAASRGFTLKSVALDNSSFATVSGTKPNFTLNLNKAGSFTATIVLEHANYADVTIKGAKFAYSIFEKTYSGGGGNGKGIYGILEASDGSLWATGSGTGTNSILVLNLSKDGGILLEKYYTGETGLDIVEASDGSLWVAGYQHNASSHGNARILKLSKDGGILLDKTFGASNRDDGASSIIEASDGSLWVAGHTASQGAGKSDVWVSNLSKDNGSVLLEKTYGGSDWDVARSIIEASDGSIWVAGYTYSQGAGKKDAWVLNLNKDNGSVLFNGTYGDSGDDDAYSIIEASDGSIWVAGYTYSQGAGKIYTWVLKLDSDNGSVLLDKTYGKSEPEGAESIIEGSDRSIWVAGYSSSKTRVLNLHKDDGSVLLDKIYSKGELNSIIEDKDGNIWVAGKKGNDAWLLGGVNK